MIRRNLKTAAIAFVIGILFSTSITVVLAAEASSPYGSYGPYLGYTYLNQAVINTGPYSVNAHTTVQTESSTSVPTGYMGAQARLFDSSGTLIEYSNMTYNDSPTSIMSTLAYTINRPGTYYSHGISAAYTGNGYDYYYTFKSPYLTY